MFSFDFASDIHVDFWVPVKDAPHKYMKKMRAFVAELIPEQPSDILILAGDLGHHNRQNMDLLTILKETYREIFFVAGNHDYYLSSSTKYKFKERSLNRFAQIEEWTQTQEGIFVLDGNTHERNGFTIGGCPMWYDNSYGKKVLGASDLQIRSVFFQDSNDRKYTYKLGEPFFKEQFRKLDAILDQCDIIVTHVPADWSHIAEKWKDHVVSSFYYFDIEPFTERLNGKVWCAGHIHENSDYERYGCRFINHALGYKESDRSGIVQKFKKITV